MLLDVALSLLVVQHVLRLGVTKIAQDILGVVWGLFEVKQLV